LPTRPDPQQRREKGTARRGDGAGQEVRHRHAVHQLPDRARRADAGGGGRRRRAAGRRWLRRRAGPRGAGPPGRPGRAGRGTPVAGRNCLEVGGVWIDDGFEASMATVVVKAQSPAYFRLLERQPRVKDLYRLGNHLLWVTPSRQALVVDTTEGKSELTDAEIDA